MCEESQSCSRTESTDSACMNSTYINIAEFDGTLSTHNMFIYEKAHSERQKAGLISQNLFCACQHFYYKIINY